MAEGKGNSEKAAGSMEVLSALQISADTAGMDQASKEIFKNKEVLAVILKGVVREFEPYSYAEIMGFIESDSITGDDIPQEEKFSISFIEMCNTKNYGSCHPDRKNYDLLTMVIIRLGDDVYSGMPENPGHDVLKFLHAVMYPHKEDFLDTVKEYVDFSQNEKLWQEVDKMSGPGASILLEGVNLSAEVFQKRIYARHWWRDQKTLDTKANAVPHTKIYEALCNRELEQCMEALRQDIAGGGHFS